MLPGSGWSPDAIHRLQESDRRHRFLGELDDRLRALVDAAEITAEAAQALGQHLDADRCAYATVEDDEDTFLVVGDYTHGVPSIVGRYTFGQFGAACLASMRAGEPFVVGDVLTDPRITEADRPAYEAASIRTVVCVPIQKQRRLVAAMAVHAVAPRTWAEGDVELVDRVASRCWESIERARVTRSLVEREQQFRDLANSIPNLAWMARPDGASYWYNDQWYRYTGTAPGETEGWGWERVHDPSVLPDVKERWQQSLATGRPFEMVFPLRSAAGEFRRFLTRVNPVRDSRGEVVRWFGTSTDVEMERRAAEATVALRQREQMLRQEAELQKRQLHALFMQAPMLIAVLRGPEHVIELANPPICQVWRRPASELVNRSIFDVLPEIGTVELRAVLDGVYRTGVPHLGAETPVLVEGATGAIETGYVTYVYSPYRTIDGAVDGIFVIAADVTAQVVARHQGNALREAAEAANRAKDEFLAMLGHELRNPLSPILTALQLMKLRGGIGAERERTVIERQVKHLTRLVDDLLDVSRIARGKVELKEETVELATIVSEAIEVSGPIVEQRSHTLDVVVPREGLAVRGDPTRLGQVVSNLLTNAAKYTPPGGRVSVQASAEHGEVVLRVADTGIGIAPEVLPRIFDLFVQERQALDRSQGGLGLGLTIARNLIERHGGTVRAWSGGVGQGSEFVVRLPRVSTAAGSHQAATDTAPTPIPPAVSAIRALIVDDNADGAEMLAAALGAKGVETRVATDPLAALQIASAYAPDVAFLDIGLPMMDGYELAARLQAMPALAGTRFVAVTGFGQSSDRRRTAEAGFQHHLVKPVDLRAIDAVLGDMPPRDG